MEATLIYADGLKDGRTDATKLISVFRDSVNAPKDDWLIRRKDVNNGGQRVCRNSLHLISFKDTKRNFS